MSRIARLWSRFERGFGPPGLATEQESNLPQPKNTTTRRAGQHLLALVLVLGCASTRAHTVTVPDPITEVGGLYQPWTARHEHEARSVLACVGLDSMGPRPTLWVAPRPMVVKDELVMAFYDPPARAIVFSPIAMQSGAYWLVFRHELLHHASHRGNDAPVFRRASECAFWPVNP